MLADTAFWHFVTADVNLYSRSSLSDSSLWWKGRGVALSSDPSTTIWSPSLVGTLVFLFVPFLEGINPAYDYVKLTMTMFELFK